MKTLLFCIACLTLVAGPAAARKPPEPKVKIKVVRGKDGKKTYVFGKMILYGKAHQPHAVLMLERKHELYRSADPGKSLATQIPNALRCSPF